MHSGPIDICMKLGKNLVGAGAAGAGIIFYYGRIHLVHLRMTGKLRTTHL